MPASTGSSITSGDEVHRQVSSDDFRFKKNSRENSEEAYSEEAYSEEAYSEEAGSAKASSNGSALVATEARLAESERLRVEKSLASAILILGPDELDYATRQKRTGTPSFSRDCVREDKNTEVSVSPRKKVRFVDPRSDGQEACPDQTPRASDAVMEQDGCNLGSLRRHDLTRRPGHLELKLLATERELERTRRCLAIADELRDELKLQVKASNEYAMKFEKVFRQHGLLSKENAKKEKTSTTWLGGTWLAVGAQHPDLAPIEAAWQAGKTQQALVLLSQLLARANVEDPRKRISTETVILGRLLRAVIETKAYSSASNSNLRHVELRIQAARDLAHDLQTLCRHAELYRGWIIECCVMWHAGYWHFLLNEHEQARKCFASAQGAPGGYEELAEIYAAMAEQKIEEQRRWEEEERARLLLLAESESAGHGPGPGPLHALARYTLGGDYA